MPTPEDKVKNEIHKELRNAGCIRAGTSEGKWPDSVHGWYYMPVKGTAMGVNGIPDFVGFRTVEVTPDMVGQRVPLFFAIEAKAPGKLNNLSANQKLRLAEMSAAGYACLVSAGTNTVTT